MALLSLLKGRFTATDWVSTWSTPSLAARLPRRCDPYLSWFDATTEAGTTGASNGIDLLVELPDDVARRLDAAEWLLKKQCEFRFPSMGHPGVPPKFLTVTAPRESVQLLAMEADEGSDRLVLRIELAMARFLPAGMGQPLWDKLKPRIRRRIELLKQLHPATADKLGTLSVRKAGPAASQPPAMPHRLPPRPLVLVIDDFCNFASRHVGTSLKTLWHQGKRRRTATAAGTPNRAAAGSDGWEYGEPYEEDEAPPPNRRSATPRACPAEEEPSSREFYGAELSFGKTFGKQLLAMGDEIGAYRLAGFSQPARLWSHGTAVMHAITATGSAPAGSDPDNSRSAPPPSHVHFVQLPDRAVLDTSGGSLAGFAIDAIHRAARIAARNCHDSIVVNLSYGTHGGPHDGTSMFERAMLEMLHLYDGREGRPALHIVLPAGNSHLWRSHAAGWLTSSGTQGDNALLHWKVQPDDDTDSFIEIWFSPDDAHVEVVIEAPGGHVLGPVIPGGVVRWVDQVDQGGQPTEVLRAAVIYPESVAQGQRGTMALIAVAPTLRRKDFGCGERYASGGQDALDQGPRRVRMEAPAGVWKIRLRNRSPSVAAGFHAWVQRDDAAPGRLRGAKGYRGRQSYLLDGAGTAVDPCFTLNGIATASAPHQRLWVVGAMDEAGRLSRYSAAGPDRDVGKRIDGPDVVMTVDRSRNQPGRLVGGTLSGSRVRLAGTSIGAAVFTRMLQHALATAGPDGPLQWCPAPHAPAPSPAMAGEPEMACDVVRGRDQKLAHLDALVLPGGAACPPMPPPRTAPAAASPSAPCAANRPPAPPAPAPS